jgi:hypothetical protein
MTIPTSDLLANLAAAQAALVAPALGDSYPGKSAGTIAAILMMLAEDARAAAGRREAALKGLRAILETAVLPDPALKADIGHLLSGETDLDAVDRADDRMERLLRAFVLVHAWADQNDPALARQCRDFLAAQTAGDLLSPPALPAG